MFTGRHACWSYVLLLTGCSQSYILYRIMYLTPVHIVHIVHIVYVCAIRPTISSLHKDKQVVLVYVVQSRTLEIF